MEDCEGMHQARMESIRGFLAYVFMRYRYIRLYLKVLYLTLDICRPYINEEGWRLQEG